VSFDINWAAQQVPFPRFGLQLKEGQSADEFMDEIEKKVSSMISESTMNEYKAYKNLVKHKKGSIGCSLRFVLKSLFALVVQAFCESFGCCCG
jgi:hypothetical protein